MSLIPNDDIADLAESVSRGFGLRLAVGEYRAVTEAVRAHAGRLTAGTDYATSDAQFQADLTAGLTPNPQRECRIATIGVTFLELAPVFGLNIPNYQEVLAVAEALEAKACGTTPPTPAQAA